MPSPHTLINLADGEQLWFLGTLATIKASAPRPTPDELRRIFAAHGQENLGPPLGPGD